MPFKDREVERTYKKRKHLENREANLEKSRAYYRAHKAHLNGLSQKWNREHRNEMAAWRKQNRESLNAKAKARRSETLEKVRAYRRDYYWNNRAKILAQAKDCRDKHPGEAYRKYVRPFQIANRQKCRAYNRKAYAKRKIVAPHIDRTYSLNRRARIKGAGGKLPYGTIPRLMKQQQGICAVCSVDLGITGHHVDHIIPLSKGGPHTPANVRLTCPHCNLSKGAKL